MKRAFLAAFLCAGLAACDAVDKGWSLGATSNTQAARQYYNSLIEGPAPNLNALTLFMTMLPKGGDLHHHYSGAIYAETFLDWMKAQEYCVWSIDNPGLKAVKFRVENNKAYKGNPACLSTDAVRNNNAFYRDLLSAWSDKDFYNHSQIQTAPDQHFFDTFLLFGNVSGVDYRGGMQELKRRAIAENVQYIETMMRSVRLPDGTEKLAASLDKLTSATGDGEMQAAFDALAADAPTSNAIAEFLDKLDSDAAGIDDDRFKMRFQTYVFRGVKPSIVFANLYASFVATNAGRRAVGVNILGPENGIVAMRDYDLHMRMFAFLKKKFPNVRLSMHAGELALGMVPPEGLQDHIRQAVEVAGAQRIGHGVDIAYERDAVGLLREMRERRVAVEVNLTSNEFILGIKNEAHPLMLYRHANVPYVISTDDAGVSRNNLSGEYVLYASRYRPSYDVLKETVVNSIRYSFLSDAEKAEQLQRLEQRFTAFEARARELANGLP